MADSQLISLREAYEAMFIFLEDYCQRTNAGDVCAMLAELAIFPDGRTGDPAAWQDWLNAVATVQSGGAKTRVYTAYTNNP